MPMIDASRETLLKGKALFNGTAHFQNENNCLNTYIYFYLEMSGG